MNHVPLVLLKYRHLKRGTKVFNELYPHCQLTPILRPKDFSVDGRKITYIASFFEKTLYC